jgi:hypothetical protein
MKKPRSFEDGIVYLIRGKCKKCGFTYANQTVVYQELTQVDAEHIVRTIHSLTDCDGEIEASIKEDVIFERIIEGIAKFLSRKYSR